MWDQSQCGNVRQHANHTHHRNLKGGEDDYVRRSIPSRRSRPLRHGKPAGMQHEMTESFDLIWQLDGRCSCRQHVSEQHANSAWLLTCWVADP